ncbi:MAG: FAD binding domain-containing protein [Candidatus Binatia bacterium]
MAKFAYFEPEDLPQALDLLREHGDEARVIAGGQSLLILIRQGLVRPAVLISPHRIRALREIKIEGGELVLGAMVTQREIASDSRIIRGLAALAQAASKVGSVHVQNLGTVGGNLSHAEPNGDSAPALISLGASVTAASSGGQRQIPMETFFRGPFENVLESAEMLTHVRVPLPADGAWSLYLKHAMRAVDRATVGIGVQLRIDAGGVCSDVHIGLCGAAPQPFRATKVESLLRGERISEPLLDAVGAALASMCDPFSDSHGPADYKRKMALVLAKRALRQAASAARYAREL